MIKKKIKTVGEPDKRFNEDALRIIRGLRFVNVLNVKLKNQGNTGDQFFDFDKPTRVSIKNNHKLVEQVAKERIKDEMMKVFKSDNPFGFISLLDETKLLEFLFPALYLTKFIEQPVRYHPFDIYTHTMLALFEIQKMNTDYLVKF
jgi:tRNA nucleotidyltransferase (CCA-adding enzyme)